MSTATQFYVVMVLIMLYLLSQVPLYPQVVRLCVASSQFLKDFDEFDCVRCVSCRG